LAVSATFCSISLAKAVELGADIIKADPTDDVAVYHKVIEVAGRVPVLVRGGGKAPEDEILRRTEQLIQRGAAGIVYGRNVIQHANPAGMTRALMAIVHDNATAEAAVENFTREMMSAETLGCRLPQGNVGIASARLVKA
jgi:DhnA family fructose-bisphosphate aldolase class Ia